MMRRTIIIALCTIFGCNAWAQNFNEWFADSTLRLDYLFTGDSEQQAVVLDELSCLPGWAGRRIRLAEVPLEGNGEITVRDKATEAVIYRMTFSSLFQEWLGEPEAELTRRGFENSFLIPYPLREAVVTIELRDARREVTASLTHTVDPADILIHRRGQERVTPHRYLLQNGSADECIDVVIMAEGYTAEEMPLFYEDAQKACDALFSHEPFRTRKERFNVIAVESVSEDSGVSIPRQGVWRTTAVNSHFDTFYSDRYLTTRSVKRIHDWLAGIPYEHIIILANTDTYGGGGIYNSYTLTTAHHSMFEPVVVHEFGHSFGGLADEYAYTDDPCPLYPYDIEPWEQNITTLVDFPAKWQDMVDADTPVPTPYQSDPEAIYNKVGVYEGGGYTKRGIYRPSSECRMKINEAPQFCPVCQRALDRMILFYTGE